MHTTLKVMRQDACSTSHQQYENTVLLFEWLTSQAVVCVVGGIVGNSKRRLLALPGCEWQNTRAHHL